VSNYKLSLNIEADSIPELVEKLKYATDSISEKVSARSKMWQFSEDGWSIKIYPMLNVKESGIILDYPQQD
jgi:hypothetical protein